MPFLNSFIQKLAFSAEKAERARLIVRLAIVGASILVAMIAYHRFCLGVPAWTTAAELGVLLAAAAIPFVLRWTRSIVFAAATLAFFGFFAVALMSVMNGGFTFHVLALSLLIPVAVPALWPRFFAISIGCCAFLFVALFALDVTGLVPEPIVSHSALGQLVVSTASLAGAFALILVINRTSSGLTYAHVAEREHYQRALLQSQKLSSLGQLSEALVHDFNNVLMSMDYALYLLGRTIDESDPRSEEIEQLELAMERAKGLSHHLEVFGADEPATEATLVIDDAVAELETLARRLVDYDVTVSFDLGSKSAKVTIEKSQLDQILVNLLVNANDAITGRGTISLTTRREGDAVVIEVSDTGSGVPAEIIDRLFNPFFTTKDADAGTGLGLWSSQTVARSAGGDLEVESEVGRGTVLRLSLPVATSEVRASSSQPISGVIATRGPVRASPMSVSESALQRSRLIKWLVATVGDPGTRMWGAAVAVVSMAGALGWLAFAGWYWLMAKSPVIAISLVGVGVCNLLALFAMRAFRSVGLAMTLLTLVNNISLGVLAYVRGGLPMPILLFLLLMPFVASMQKEYRFLVPGSALVFVGIVGFFFVRTASGDATPIISISPFADAIEGLIALCAALGLFGLAARTGHLVDRRLLAECDQFHRALVRSQKLESIGVFASSIAHDLNNVLMSLEFSTALLDEAVPAEHPGRIEIEQLRDDCARVRQLSRRLVRFGRDEEGDADVVVDSTLLGLASMIRPLLGSHIELKYDLAAGQARVHIASKRFEQVIFNLLLNARDSMPDGGDLTLRTRADDKHLTVDVADSGVGISVEIHDQIFDPFFTTETEATKSGLGLWLCRGLAEDAGGAVSLKSTSTSGTTMSVLLPRFQRRRASTSNQFDELVRRRASALPGASNVGIERGRREL